MTLFNRDEVVKRALASQANVPATCQLWTRTIIGAPSVGDVDGDKDADAVDGWKSEPASAKHTDRNPPAGVPVAWSGGKSGFGHRAVSLGGGKIRSTDAGGRGVVATVDLGWVERNWGLTYLGWSETMSGQKIPLAPAPPKPAPKPLTSRGRHIERAIRELNEAKPGRAGSPRHALIKTALAALKRVPKIK